MRVCVVSEGGKARRRVGGERKSREIKREGK